MPKPQTVFTCTKCDAQSHKWSGRCLACGTWGSLIESAAQQRQTAGPASAPAKILSLTDLEQSPIERLSTGLIEIDRVFGGGLVPGSLILLGGEPGIGKSTIVAQIAQLLPPDKKIIYASGEESVQQISLRLARLNITADRLAFIADNEVGAIIAALKPNPPALLIIDSIQTLRSDLEPGSAGGLAQVRAATGQLLEFAKSSQTAVIIIGHVTKDGTLAGPKTLEHLVDTVIYLETDQSQNYRLLRASKNRFGSINEIGVFEMTATGLLAVSNPTSIFLDHGHAPASGSVISAVMEGTRPFLIEVQALTAKTVFGYPQRRAAGLDANRLQILTAVMGKRAKINLGTHDIILNIVGGLKITDPSLDLAVCLAIASSLGEQLIDHHTLVLGEVGLGGEVRAVPQLETRLREALKLGFTQAIVPKAVTLPGLEIVVVKNLTESLEAIKK